MSIISEQIKAIMEEDDMIAAFSNASACIAVNYDRLNWAGFYFVKNNELVLGPFQGKVACTHIPFSKGVCGKCYSTAKPQRIDDVLSFKGHIACDSDSRSELCVPIIVDGQVVAEIDLDSPFTARFTEEMQNEMLESAKAIANAFHQHHWMIQ